MLNNQSTNTDSSKQAEQPTSNSYFIGGHWGQCLELICHLCQYSDNILLISGANGMGKTSLKQAFMAKTYEFVKSCDLQLESQTSIPEIIHRVSNGFGLSLDDDNFNSYVPSDKTWVLLIDDAQQLAADALDAIVSLVTKLQGKLRLMLFGTEDLENRFASYDKVKYQVIELEPLSFREVGPYLLHKWRSANNRTELPFSKSDIKAIYNQSKGNPKKIMRIAKQILSGEKPKHKRNLGLMFKKISLYVATLFSMILLVYLIYLFIQFGDSAISQRNNPTVEIKVVPERPEIKPDSKVQPMEQVSTEDTEEDNDYVNSPFIETIAKIKSEQLKKQKIIEPEVVKPEPKIQPILPKEPAKPKVIKSVTAKDKILDADPNHYTLQLLGAGKEQNIKNYIAEHKLGNNARYFETKLNGKPWYVLLYGEYNSQQQAKQELADLQSQIKGLQPWLRSYASVQKSIKSKG